MKVDWMTKKYRDGVHRRRREDAYISLESDGIKSLRPRGQTYEGFILMSIILIKKKETHEKSKDKMFQLQARLWPRGRNISETDL